MTDKQIEELLKTLSLDELSSVIQIANERKETIKKNKAESIKANIIQLLEQLKPYVLPPYYFHCVVEDDEGIGFDTSVEIDINDVIKIIKEM